MTFKELALELAEVEAGEVQVNIAQLREVLSRLCQLVKAEPLEVMEVLIKQALKAK